VQFYVLLCSIAIHLFFVTDTSTCHFSAKVTTSAYGLLNLHNNAKLSTYLCRRDSE